MKKQYLKNIKRILLILFGNLSIAAGLVFFIVPAGFITGGVTGFSLVLEQYLHLPISYGIAILSVLLLFVGWIFLGKKFAAESALSALSFPAFVWVLERVSAMINFKTDSIVLNLGCAGLLFGYGIATVMRVGASTGGLDTIAMILYKKRGVPLALTVNICEIVAMSTQIFYSKPDEIIGGVLLTIFYTTLINHFIATGIARVQVMIYSKEYEKINSYIDYSLQRGSTLFKAEGGYSRDDMYVLQTVISNRELFSLKEMVLRVDPTAFMVVSEIMQVNGKGFTIEHDEEPKSVNKDTPPS